MKKFSLTLAIVLSLLAGYGFAQMGPMMGGMGWHHDENSMPMYGYGQEMKRMNRGHSHMGMGMMGMSLGEFQVEKIEKGIIIRITSEKPEEISLIQKHGEMMKLKQEIHKEWSKRKK